MMASCRMVGSIAIQSYFHICSRSSSIKAVVSRPSTETFPDAHCERGEHLAYISTRVNVSEHLTISPLSCTPGQQRWPAAAVQPPKSRRRSAGRLGGRPVERAAISGPRARQGCPHGDAAVRGHRSPARHTEIADDEPALARLKEVLFPLLIVERTMDLALVSTFKRLGAGSFATVFVSEVRGGVVVKQVQDPANANLLCKEHSHLQKLVEECKAAGPSFFSLPHPYGFYDTYYHFATEVDIPRTVDLGLPPHAMYVMQRKWPVPASLTERIRVLFFPDAIKNDPFAPFLARLYMGRTHSRTGSRFFSSENFPLDAARIEQLGLPSDEIAAGMGQLLARINFRAGLDGRDIEFVLCGDAGNPLSKKPAFSCIDFNQMRPHSGEAANIVSAIVANDPYYPRPSSLHWKSFADAYTFEAARMNSSSADELSQQVLSALLERWVKQSQ